LSGRIFGAASLYAIRGGARSYNAYNSRGDVVSKTDDASAITWQAAYEAFGTRTQEQGTTQDRQKANTKDEDPTGLLNEGMRYRDLEFGVFLTRDPLGFVDGPNVYTYVRQNPWTFFDPLGLRKTDSGFEVEGTGHHEVPVDLWDKHGFTDHEALDVFDKSTIDTPDHNNTAHGLKNGYTGQVDAELDSFKKDWAKNNNLKSSDISGMSAKDQKKLAKDFVEHLRHGTKNEYIKGFNKVVKHGSKALAKWDKVAGPALKGAVEASSAGKFIKKNGRRVPFMKYALAATTFTTVFNSQLAKGKTVDEAYSVAAFDTANPLPVGVDDLEAMGEVVGEEVHKIEKGLNNRFELPDGGSLLD
jgi:RHS repeat-associated protein